MSLINIFTQTLSFIMDTTHRSLSDEKLESHKEEIYRIYKKENNTLQATMSIIEKKYGSIAR